MVCRMLDIGAVTDLIDSSTLSVMSSRGWLVRFASRSRGLKPDEGVWVVSAGCGGYCRSATREESVFDQIAQTFVIRFEFPLSAAGICG